jgi:hypothetical protein
MNIFSDLEFNVEQEKDRVSKPKDDMDFANEFDDDGDEEEFNKSNEEKGIEARDQDDEASDEDVAENAAITSSHDDPNEMAVLNVLAIWRQYQPLLLNDFSHVGYLVSPHPKIVEHARNPDKQWSILSRKWALPLFQPQEDAGREVAELVHTFWTKQALFHNNQGYFAKPGIWFIANDEKTLADEWHKNYSQPVTRVFGIWKVSLLCLCSSIGDWSSCKMLESNQKEQEQEWEAVTPIF